MPGNVKSITNQMPVNDDLLIKFKNVFIVFFVFFFQKDLITEAKSFV